MQLSKQKRADWAAVPNVPHFFPNVSAYPPLNLLFQTFTHQFTPEAKKTGQCCIDGDNPSKLKVFYGPRRALPIAIRDNWSRSKPRSATSVHMSLSILSVLSPIHSYM